ncbi:MAG: DNA-protecting protein DprA [Planctomycetota bacterium]|nr:MAG: DNA-protecting protein DprA [Planctomycetota bacterium]
MDPSDSASHREMMVRDMLALVLVSGVGPVIIRNLLNQFGTASAAIRAGESRLKAVENIGPKLAEKIARALDNTEIDKEIALCKDHQVAIMLQSDDDFPECLREMPDCPAMLFVKGRIEPIDRLAVAVVGSRRSTQYGRRMADKLATSLARSGMTVVSGLARGIDEAAHRGALNGGGRTLAVLANGLSQIYPPEMVPLANEIIKQGAIISEMPMGHPPLAELFIRRNRIISGLSLGVVVVEAAIRSGSLSTARHAMEQNRDVFAVPGPADSITSQGCHRLIRDGAKLVETVDDIIEELKPRVKHLMGDVQEAQQQRLFDLEAEDPAPGPDQASPPIPRSPQKAKGPISPQSSSKNVSPAVASLGPEELELYALIGDEPTGADELISKSALPSGRVMALLSLMEMRRVVKRSPGPSFSRY